MSASEFIGRIEDLNETYDMIYLGSSTDGFNLSGGETDYNDPDMDGLLYSNVGDLYYSSYGMSGLLDRDYYWERLLRNTIDARSGTKSNLFRSRATTWTPAKVEALENFAAAGYPVILANDLVTGSASTTVNYTFNVSIIPGAADGDSVLLTAVPSVSGYTGAYTFGYQWYRADDTAVSGAVSAAYDAPAGDSYYCRDTVSGAYLTTTSSAKSPIYQVTNDACSVSGGGTGTPGSYQTESGGPGGANSHLIPDRTDQRETTAGRSTPRVRRIRVFHRRLRQLLEQCCFTFFQQFQHRHGILCRLPSRGKLYAQRTFTTSSKAVDLYRSGSSQTTTIQANQASVSATYPLRLRPRRR
jgi:hypothetical protein